MTIRNLIQDINQKEWTLIVIVIFVIIVITSIPHIYGFLNTPEGFTYWGRQMLNSHDTPVYFSYLEQVQQGHWLFENLFTTESQIKIFNPFWLFTGLIGKIFNLPVAVTFQVTRIILIPFLITICYLFISYFFQNKQERKVCFVMLLFSSGFGVLASRWLTPLYREKYGYANWPMDTWVPESNTFFTLYHTPHLIFSLSLILLIFLLTLTSFENNKKRYSILAGLLALLLFQFHPFHVPTVFGVLGIYLIILCLKYRKIRWNLIGHLAIVFLLSLPAIVYHLLTMKYDWTIWQKAIQNVCLTPSWLMVLVSYGLLTILAIIGIISIWKNKLYNNRNLFLIAWPITQFLLIYLPVNFQRRLTEGLHVGVTLLANFGLFFVYNFLKNKIGPKFFLLVVNNKMLIWIIFPIVFCCSNIFILGQDIIYAYAYSKVFYISYNKLSAIKWLAQNTSFTSQIFSSPANGNIIPAFSARNVYVGHGVETAFYLQKTKETEWFFKDNKRDEQKKTFLKKNNLNYLFYETEEKKLGSFNPEEKKYLKKVYQNDEVTIYKIINL